MITLTDDQIEKQYHMHHAIEDVKNVLQDLKDDAIIQAHRTVLPVDDNSSMLYMTCISRVSRISIIKTISIFPLNKDLPIMQRNLLLTDLTKSEHKATMDASCLKRLRTGAIGTGNMAFEQVLGVLEVYDI